MGTLAELISNLPLDERARGREFERICMWFLTHDPVYSALLRRVWLWNDWPGRWGADTGIDLVAEARDGSAWAIQAKAYAPTTAVSKRDIDSFLSESNREQFAFRLLIATTDLIGHNARQVMHGQEKPAALLMLGDLRARPIEWPDDAAARRAPTRPRLTPRPHQREALEAIDGVPVNGRGRVIMACGTGKTLVQLWAHERLRSRRTLVLVPSLFLVAQSMLAWTANRRDPFEFLAVCSDDSVTGADSFTADVSEIGVPVTTQPDRIRQFLSGDAPQVVFSTYQSSPRVAEALSGTGIQFDLVIADEAHQLAGNVARGFATVLDNERIPSRRKIFFTATPRYFTGRRANISGESDLEVASMDDEEVFGPEVHRLSFGEAIQRDLLSDYRVVVVGVTDREAYELARDGVFVEFHGKLTDARSLAREIGLAKAMHDFELRRVISFHSRVRLASRFAADLADVIGKLPEGRAPQGPLTFDFVSGDMSTGERRSRLDRLRNIPSGEYALLANARCLSEGIDVPSIDGVAFIDPRRSQIDIVQAVGRAIRKSERKAVGTIVIPVLVPEDEDAETVLDDSTFEPVWSVVRALRDHDERLADQLDAARRKKGNEGRLTRDDLPDRIVLDLPETVAGGGFIDAIITRIVERTTSPWEEAYAELRRYADANGHARVPLRFKTPGGLRLGYWASNQRQRFRLGKLDARRVDALKRLAGWTFDSREARWQECFEELRAFVESTGHSRVPQGWTTASGFALGAWVSNQRTHHRTHTLSPERVAALERLPGWAFHDFDTVWERGYEELCAYARRVGHARVPGHFETVGGFKLGVWVGRQRYLHKRGNLEQQRVERLESVPGWTFYLHDARWEDGFLQITRYVEAKGDCLVPQHFKTDDGYPLGAWVGTQRLLYGRGELSPERVARLLALPGWAFSVRTRRRGVSSLPRP